MSDPLVEAARVEVAKLELGPNDILFVKGDLPPAEARYLVAALRETLRDNGRSDVLVLAGPYDVAVVTVQEHVQGWLADQLADRVAERLAKRWQSRGVLEVADDVSPEDVRRLQESLDEADPEHEHHVVVTKRAAPRAEPRRYEYPVGGHEPIPVPGSEDMLVSICDVCYETIAHHDKSKGWEHRPSSKPSSKPYEPF